MMALASAIPGGIPLHESDYQLTSNSLKRFTPRVDDVLPPTKRVRMNKGGYIHEGGISQKDQQEQRQDTGTPTIGRPNEAGEEPGRQVTPVKEAVVANPEGSEGATSHKDQQKQYVDAHTQTIDQQDQAGEETSEQIKALESQTRDLGDQCQLAKSQLKDCKETAELQLRRADHQTALARDECVERITILQNRVETEQKLRQQAESQLKEAKNNFAKAMWQLQEPLDNGDVTSTAMTGVENVAGSQDAEEFELESLWKKLKEKIGELKEKDDKLKKKDEELKEKEGELKEKEGELEEIEGELKEIEDELIRREQVSQQTEELPMEDSPEDTEIPDLRLSFALEEIARLNAELQSRDKLVEELRGSPDPLDEDMVDYQYDDSEEEDEFGTGDGASEVEFDRLELAEDDEDLNGPLTESYEPEDAPDDLETYFGSHEADLEQASGGSGQVFDRAENVKYNLEAESEEYDDCVEKESDGIPAEQFDEEEVLEIGAGNGGQTISKKGQKAAVNVSKKGITAPSAGHGGISKSRKESTVARSTNKDGPQLRRSARIGVQKNTKPQSKKLNNDFASLRKNIEQKKFGVQQLDDSDDKCNFKTKVTLTFDDVARILAEDEKKREKEFYANPFDDETRAEIRERAQEAYDEIVQDVEEGLISHIRNDKAVYNGDKTKAAKAIKTKYANVEIVFLAEDDYEPDSITRAIPMELKTKGVNDRVFKSMCFLAKHRLLQFEAAEKVLGKEDLWKLHDRLFAEAGYQTKATGGHQIESFAEFGEVWEKEHEVLGKQWKIVKDALTRMPKFRNACKYYADGEE